MKIPPKNYEGVVVYKCIHRNTLEGFIATELDILGCPINQLNFTHFKIFSIGLIHKLSIALIFISI